MAVRARTFHTMYEVTIGCRSISAAAAAEQIQYNHDWTYTTTYKGTTKLHGEPSDVCSQEGLELVYIVTSLCSASAAGMCTTNEEMH